MSTRPTLSLLDADAPPQFPHPQQALREPDGLLAVGGKLNPEWVLTAYKHGIFPWFGEGEPPLWWSPDPRCVFATAPVHVSRSLRKHMRHCGWQLTLNRAFLAVIRACARPDSSTGSWITPAMITTYHALHRAGHAHSIEIWEADRLIGGLYGVAIGRLFCGESMFSHRSNASKVALTGIRHLLHQWQMPLLDAQVGNPHLYRMGAQNLPRPAFLQAVQQLTALPSPPDAFKLAQPMDVKVLAHQAIASTRHASS